MGGYYYLYYLSFILPFLSTNYNLYYYNLHNFNMGTIWLKLTYFHTPGKLKSFTANGLVYSTIY